MADKSPKSGKDKKQGKSLKEKRALKHAKRAERSAGRSSPLGPPPSG